MGGSGSETDEDKSGVKDSQPIDIRKGRETVDDEHVPFSSPQYVAQKVRFVVGCGVNAIFSVAGTMTRKRK